MKVVTVGGKVYEIDGLPHGGTLPMWQLLRQNGQPMMPEMLDQLSDAEKRELDAQAQEYIRETAAYQAEVAARSAALARGEKLPDEGSGLLEPAQSFPPAPPTSATPPVTGEAAISAAYNTSPYNTAAHNASPAPILAEPSGPSRPPSPGPGTLRPHGPAEPPAPQPSYFGFGEAGDRDGFNQGPFQTSTVVPPTPVAGVALRDPNDRTGEVPDEATSITQAAVPPMTVPLSGRATAGSGGRANLRAGANVGATQDHQLSAIKDNHHNLFLLALAFEYQAREGIRKLHLDNKGRNDPTTIERNNEQIELLTILADGFAQIAAALKDVAENPDQSVLLGKPREIARAISERLQAWWQNKGVEAIDTSGRISLFIAGVAVLGGLGADTTAGMASLAAIVGGPKVAEALRRPQKTD